MSTTTATILIVDDEDDIRSLMRDFLEADGYTVLSVPDGPGALSALKANPVDLVLLDYNMPGFNGIETLTEIKRVAPQVNVVIMTSTENTGLAYQAVASGAAAFLRKPFYPTDIDEILDRIYA